LVLSRRAEALDSAVEVAAVDEVDDLDAVGEAAEEQAVFAPDPLAQDAGAGAQLHDVGEGRAFAAGEAADHGEGRAGGLAREIVEGLAEFVGELDEPQGPYASRRSP
jgi:hypothetical protein